MIGLQVALYLAAAVIHTCDFRIIKTELVRNETKSLLNVDSYIFIPLTFKIKYRVGSSYLYECCVVKIIGHTHYGGKMYTGL
jgi:hypothetical protein